MSVGLFSTKQMNRLVLRGTKSQTDPYFDKHNVTQDQWKILQIQVLINNLKLILRCLS